MADFFGLLPSGAQVAPHAAQPVKTEVQPWAAPRDELTSAIMAPFETPPALRKTPPSKLGAPPEPVQAPTESVVEVPELDIPDGMSVDLDPPDLGPTPSPIPNLAANIRESNGPKLRSITDYAGLTGQQPGTFEVDARFREQGVSAKLKDRFALLQNSFGEQLQVNSVYRDPQKNAAVGGARGSQHMHGNAVDINVSDWPKEKRVALIEQASAQGFGGIGVGDNIIHIDVGNRRAWGYRTAAGGGPVPGWARPAINRHLSGELMKKTTGAGRGDPVVSAYSPQQGGDKMEGGYASSRRGPDGKFEVRTLADVTAGRSDYITLAGDSSQYGKEYTIPEITYHNANGDPVTLKNVRGVVHDTGSAFKGKGSTRFDIPVDRDLTSDALNKQPFSMKTARFILNK